MADANFQAVAHRYIDMLMKSDSTLVDLVTAEPTEEIPSPPTRIYANFSLEASRGGVVYPLVSYHFISGRNIRTMGARRLFTDCLYGAIAHGTGGYGVIAPIADRIITIFDAQSAVPVVYAGDTYSLNSYCEDEIELPPDVLPGGQVAYARGSKLRIYVSALS